MIEKLIEYTSTINGSDCICHPNLEDCVNKINELIDIINSFQENYILIPRHEDDALDLCSADLLSIRDGIDKVLARKGMIYEM